VVVTLAVFVIVVGLATTGATAVTITVALALAAREPKLAVTTPFVTEHVPGVTVQAMAVRPADTVLVTVVLAAAPFPVFCTVMPQPIPPPETAGEGSVPRLMTRSAGGRSVSVLATDGTWLEEPDGLVATAVKAPLAEALNETPSVATVPLALTLTELTAMAAGLKAGANAKLAPVRFEPFTVIVVVLGIV
jgi:hypothetical protein